MYILYVLSQAELKDRKGEPLPSGWTVDKSGHVSYLVYRLYNFVFVSHNMTTCYSVL